MYKKALIYIENDIKRNQYGETSNMEDKDGYKLQKKDNVLKMYSKGFSKIAYYDTP
jgi:hypothetical protein